ncbi:uncharacterized protein LOC110452173 isoform X1 [Mizuhopecten yessoensis]|uniref:uncharacterized protein LOC110452173 isoform X1 n=1 Tax=Mizuhopecten yessoensis TaxID=6573 RepID=UPI000B458928|nr:uncharacterized protein LOC110452173 isoform X1 [Mizuhopecten yessoensis]
MQVYINILSIMIVMVIIVRARSLIRLYVYRCFGNIIWWPFTPKPYTCTELAGHEGIPAINVTTTPSDIRMVETDHKERKTVYLSPLMEVAEQMQKGSRAQAMFDYLKKYGDLGRPIHPPWEPRRIPAASEDSQSPLPELEEVVVHSGDNRDGRCRTAEDAQSSVQELQEVVVDSSCYNRDERCPTADRERVDGYRRSDGAGKDNMENAWTTPGPPLPRMEPSGIPPAASRTNPN